MKANAIEIKEVDNKDGTRSIYFKDLGEVEIPQVNKYWAKIKGKIIDIISNLIQLTPSL